MDEGKIRWPGDPAGKRGMLHQKCTQEYKIRPMDRAVRRILARDFGIPIKSGRIPEGIVEKWIGFSADEVDRAKPPGQKYITFRYPLIEMGIKKDACATWFLDRGLAMPPRSVCNACFAHSPRDLQEMHDKAPRGLGAGGSGGQGGPRLDPDRGASPGLRLRQPDPPRRASGPWLPGQGGQRRSGQLR